jgi:hypothetical protein
VNQEVSSEDRTILAALELLERGTGEPLVADGAGDPSDPSDTAVMLARLYTEVLGLLPGGLEPAAPRLETRARLLAAVTGVATPAAEPVRRTAPLPVNPAPEQDTQEIDPRPAPAPRPAVRAIPAVSHEMPAIPAVPRPAPPPLWAAPRRRPWPLALAAALVLVLGGLSGWLVQQRAEQEVTIEALRSQLEGERRKAEHATAEAIEARQRVDRMQANFSLVTAPAVTVSPLHPTGEPSRARGMLFVAPDHQHWYMAVHDLPPAAPGLDYQLWWVAGEGTVSGGTFDTRTGEKMELSSETMPANTRDVIITLEAEGGAPRPTGPEVLRAAGVYDIS